MSNNLSRRAAPLAKVFLESRMVRKGLGTKRFDQKKLSGPRGGLGQKCSFAKSGLAPMVLVQVFRVCVSSGL